MRKSLNLEELYHVSRCSYGYCNIHVVTLLAQNHVEEVFKIRRCSDPNQKVIELYDALKYKYAPFKEKKSVVHKFELEELQIIEQQLFWSD